MPQLGPPINSEISDLIIAVVWIILWLITSIIASKKSDISKIVKNKISKDVEAISKTDTGEFQKAFVDMDTNVAMKLPTPSNIAEKMRLYNSSIMQIVVDQLVEDVSDLKIWKEMQHKKLEWVHQKMMEEKAG